MDYKATVKAEITLQAEDEGDARNKLAEMVYVQVAPYTELTVLEVETVEEEDA
jgi:hypothetical protein